MVNSKVLEKTGQLQGPMPMGGKFAKGKSGNPNGRPKGSRNRATLAAEALLDSDAKQITERCIEMAKAGDTVALRLCMERILPARKCRPLKVNLPKISGPEGVLTSVNAIISAISKGQITPDEADALLRIVEVARKAIETEEVHRELDELQTKLELIGA